LQRHGVSFFVVISVFKEDSGAMAVGDHGGKREFDVSANVGLGAIDALECTWLTRAQSKISPVIFVAGYLIK